jgi:hypothetical protein
MSETSQGRRRVEETNGQRKCSKEFEDEGLERFHEAFELAGAAGDRTCEKEEKFKGD